MKNSEIFAFSVYDYIFRYWFYGRLPYAVIRWNQPYREPFCPLECMYVCRTHNDRHLYVCTVLVIDNWATVIQDVHTGRLVQWHRILLHNQPQWMYIYLKWIYQDAYSKFLSMTKGFALLKINSVSWTHNIYLAEGRANVAQTCTYVLRVN
jgi:hypothetical protein